METNFHEIENESKKNKVKENIKIEHNEKNDSYNEYLDDYQIFKIINIENNSDEFSYNEYNLFEEQKEISTNPVTLNINEKKKNIPGRKKNTSNKYTSTHTRINPDNCRVKIKCHYNNFIIDFFNKLIKKKFNKQIYKFRKLPYDISKNVSKKYNKSLLNTKIKDILTMEISGKYKNIDPQQNINTFNKSKFLTLEYKELLEMKYDEFYQKIYLPDNYNEIKNKYNLDKNTIKGDLKQILNNLENKNQLNGEYKNKILNVAKYEFIDYFLSNKNLIYK